MIKASNHKIAPGPRGYLLLGNLLAVRRDRLKFLMKVVREFGNIVRFQMGPKILNLINHPDYIKWVLQDNYQNYRKGIGLSQAKSFLGDGLLTSEGQLWLHQRRLMQPAFNRKRLTEVVTIITEATSSMLERWQTFDKGSQSVNIASEMMQLTLHILGKALFGIDILSATDGVSNAFTLLQEEAIRRMSSIFNVPESLPTPRNLRIKNALRILNEFVYTMIKERHESKEDNGDLLSTLIHACDTETGKNMTEKQLRDEVITILFTGHETTANALAWTLYLVSKYPLVKRKLLDELIEVLSGQTPTLGDIANLKYTKMIVEESMRLYPPVWLIPRKSIGDDEIDGYHIPAGSGVLISPYSMHRHPAFWENPETFDPERFTSERSAERPQYTYFPFGGGPRYCIGSSFAMIETQLIVAMIAQKYSLHLVPGHPVDPEPLLSLRPRYGVLMTLHEVSNKL